MPRTFLCFFSLVLLLLLIATQVFASSTLEVKHVYPQGEQQQIDRLIIVFNHAMIKDGEYDQVPKGILSISPPVKGNAYWHDLKTLHYVFDAPVKEGKRFKFTLHSGIKSLSGDALKKPYVWTAELSGPGKKIQVLRSNNTTSEFDAKKVLQPTWFVIFNKQLKPEELYNGAYFVYSIYDPSSKKNREINVAASLGEYDKSKNNNDGWFAHFYPRQGLPPNISYQLYLRKGRSSADGKASLKDDLLLASGNTYGKLNADIHGTPSSYAKNYYSPEHSIYIKFSNPVNLHQACLHIDIDNDYDMASFRQKCFDLSESQASGSFVSLDKLHPGSSYKISIKEGLTDIYGQILDRPTYLNANIAPMSSWIAQGPGMGFIEKNPEGDLNFLISNSTDLKIYAAVLPKKAAVAHLLNSVQDSSTRASRLQSAETLLNRIKVWNWSKAVLPPHDVQIKESWLTLPMKKFFNYDEGQMFLVKLEGSDDFAYSRQKKFLEEALSNAYKHKPVPQINMGDDEKIYKKRMAQLELDNQRLISTIKKSHKQLINDRKNSKIKVKDVYSLFYASDLAISYKVASSSSIVWTTRVSDGQIYPNVKLELLNKNAEIIWSGTSDENGLAALPGTDKFANTDDSAFVIFASSDRDKAWQKIYADLKSGEYDAVNRQWISYHNASGKLPNGWRLSWLLSSLPVYRPGDQVHFKIISRNISKDKFQAIKDEIVLVSIYDPHKRLYNKKILPVSGLGTVNHAFDLPKDSALGMWSVYMTPTGTSEPLIRPEYLIGYLPVFNSKNISLDFIFPDINENAIIIGAGKNAENSLTIQVRSKLKKLPKNLMASYKIITSKTDFKITGFEDYNTIATFQPQTDRYQAVQNNKILTNFQAAFYNSSLTRLHAAIYPQLASSWNNKELQYDIKTIHGEAAITDNGSLDIPFPKLLKDQYGPRLYSFSIEAGKGIEHGSYADHSFLAHSASLYAGLKAKTFVVPGSSPAIVDMITADLKGKIVPDVSVNIRLYRRSWIDDNSAYDHCSNKARMPMARDRLVQSKQIFSEKNPVHINFGSLPPGHYWVMAELEDEEGGFNAATTEFYVGGAIAESNMLLNEENFQDINGEDVQAGRHLALFTDKEIYEPGEIAKIMIQSPFDKAKGLLTLERNGIHFSKVFAFDTQNPMLEVPIDAASAPNIFLSVMLLKGRTAKKPQAGEADTGKPAIRIGYKEIKVTSKDEQWIVEIQADKRDIKAKEEVTLNVQLKDGHGRHISANEAELALIVTRKKFINRLGSASYYPQQLMQSNMTHSAHRMATVSSLDSLITGEDWRKAGLMPGSACLFNINGDASDSRQPISTLGLIDYNENFIPPSSDDPLVFFAPLVPIGLDGRAQVKIKMPDAYGELSVFAVATGQGRKGGTGQYTLRLKKDVEIVPLLPLYMGYGDEFTAAVTVHNHSLKGALATVGIEGQHAAILDVKDQTINLGPGESQDVFFTVKANQWAEEIILTIKAELNGKSDIHEYKIPLQAYNKIKTQMFYELLQSTQGKLSNKMFTIKLDKDLDLSRGDISIELAPGLSGIVSTYYDWLASHDSCSCSLEMANSVNMGRLVWLNLSERLPYDPQWNEQAIDNIKFYFTQLSNWSQTGNFLSSPEANASHVNKSVYNNAFVLDFIMRAEKKGLRANDANLQDNIVLFLKKHLTLPDDAEVYGAQYTASEQRAIKIYAISVLAKAGENVDEYIDKFYNNRDHLSLYEQAYLLQAIAHQHNMEKIGERLGAISRRIGAQVSKKTGEINGSQKMPNLPGLWASSLGLKAVLISSLCEAVPGHELIEILMGSLVKDLSKTPSYQTGDNVYIMLAINDYLKQASTESPNLNIAAYLNSSPFVQAVFSSSIHKPVSNNIKLSDLSIQPGDSLNVNLESKGEGWSWATIKVASAKKNIDLKAKPTNIFELKKKTVLVSTEEKRALKDGHFVKNDQLKITLTLNVKSDAYGVILEDHIPAGLKSISIADDESQTKSQAQWYERHEVWPDKIRYEAPHLKTGIYKVSYFAHATTSGQYIDLGAQALEKNKASLQAKSNGQRIVIE